MVGMTPLMRSLPEVLPDAKWSRLKPDIDVGEDGSLALDFVDKSESSAPLSSGIVFNMFSNSLTTTSMDGRSSGLSWQQLMAKATNLSKHSGVKEPNVVSTIERIVPVWCANFTWCKHKMSKEKVKITILVHLLRCF